MLLKLFLFHLFFFQLLRSDPLGLTPLSSLDVEPTLVNLVAFHGSSPRSCTDLFGFRRLLVRQRLRTPLLAALDIVDVQPFYLFFCLQA